MITTTTTTVTPMSPTWTSRTLVPACAHASRMDVQGTRAPIAAQGVDVARAAKRFPGTTAWRPPSG